MTSRTARLGWLLATAVSLGAGCADFSRGKTVPNGGAGSDGAAGGAAGSGANAGGSFAADVESLLVTCMRCHVPGQEAGDTTLLLTGVASSDYAIVTPFVSTGAPSSSVLLAKMSGAGHGGGTVYAAGSPQYQTVLLWIQEGAPP